MRDGNGIRRLAVGLALALLALAATAGPAAAAVRYVATSGNDLPNDCSNESQPCLTINHAIAVANAGDTIKIGPGDFTITNGPVVGQPLTLEGAQAGVDGRERNVPLSQETILEAGATSPVRVAAGAGAGGHVVIDGFRIGPALNEPYGVEIQAGGGGSHVFRNNVFSGAPEVAAVGGPLAGVTFERNEVLNNATSLKASGAANLTVVSDNRFVGTVAQDLSFLEGGTDVTIEGNERTGGQGAFAALEHTSEVDLVGNSVESTEGPAVLLGGDTTETLVSGDRFGAIDSAAIRMTELEPSLGANEGIAILGSTLTGNAAAIEATAPGTIGGGVLAEGNRIVGNTAGIVNLSGSPVEAPENWWGCNAGAGAGACDTVSGEVDAEPHLVLSASTMPPDVYTGESSTVTVELAEDSEGHPFLGGAIPGTPFELSAAQGSFSPAGGQLDAQGTGTSTYTAGSVPGMPGASAKVDNQTVTAPLTVHALLTGSQITSPASPAFAIWNADQPNGVTVAGTTSGGVPGDTKVDLDCFSAGGVEVLKSGVELAGDGSFSAADVSLEEPAAGLCRLRAVTAGTTPADPAPFAGPLLAVGLRHLEAFASGPAIGQPYDFSASAQQLSAGGAYRGIGTCGVQGYLDNAALERTTTTFSCGDRLWGFDNYDVPEASTRSQIQIDGEDAYTASSIEESVGGIEDFPAISFSMSQDPLTGNTTITDREAFDTCPTQAYPAIDAGCLVDGGVRVERTIEQTADGHLVTVTDRYSSTDGQAHSLDLLPENEQRFAASGEERPGPVIYRFPGEASYDWHVSGEVVPFAGEAPAAVMIKVGGAADGEEGTGQGAIVFDRPASPARFNLTEEEGGEERSGFELHQTATVPASGSTSFRTAYVQGYSSAEVEALVAQAKAAFTPPPPPPPPPPAALPAPPGPPTARARLKLLKVELDRRAGTASVLASVSGAGRLRLSGKGVGTATAVSRGAGAVELPVRPTGGTRAQLADRGGASVRLTVSFSPKGGGAAVSATRSIVLKKRSGPARR